MNRTITVSEETYARLEAMAQQQGLSVEQLIGGWSEQAHQGAEGEPRMVGQERLAQLVALHEAIFPHARDATPEESASVDRAMQQKVQRRLPLVRLALLTQPG
jgi:hypothetical protein